MNTLFIFTLIGVVLTIGVTFSVIDSFPMVVAGSDSQCQNQHEREDRFLDRYEEDPENNGKLCFVA
jgi:hypothetical protein